jgi:hypothetical protein
MHVSDPPELYVTVDAGGQTSVRWTASPDSLLSYSRTAEMWVHTWNTLRGALLSLGNINTAAKTRTSDARPHIFHGNGDQIMGLSFVYSVISILLRSLFAFSTPFLLTYLLLIGSYFSFSLSLCNAFSHSLLFAPSCFPRNGKKNAVLRDVKPCGSCNSRRFGGTYRHHHQGDKNQRARNNVSSN